MTVPNKNQNMGKGGSCICPKCGYKKSHQRGIPCQEERCPNCNGKLLREDSYHHNLLKEKRNKK